MFVMRSCFVFATLMLMVALSYIKTTSSSLPTPAKEVRVTVVPQHSSEVKRTYDYTEQMYEDVRKSKVVVQEWERQGLFVRQFGEKKDDFMFAEFPDGSIKFDFGNTFLSNEPLYPIKAGETRKYFTAEDQEVVLIAEADETLVIGNLQYHCLRFHLDLPMQDGNIVDLRWWLTSDGMLVRYTREMQDVFSLQWDIENGSTPEEAFASK